MVSATILGRRLLADVMTCPLGRLDFAAGEVSRDPELDRVLQRAIAASGAFYDTLRAELVQRLDEKNRAGASVAELHAEALSVLQEYVPALADLLADADLAGWLNGASGVAQLIPLPERSQPSALTKSSPSAGETEPPPTLPEWRGLTSWLPVIEAAVHDLHDRQLVTRRDFDRMDERARKGAFTVAHLKTTEAIGKVHEAVTDAVAEGDSFSTFKRKVDRALGTSTLGVGHMENVFRTNVASAYSRGFDDIADHPVVAELYPFVETMPIRDSRLTDLCRIVAESGIDGTAIYLRSDPVWQRYKSPRHYQDRCGQRLLSVRDAARRGIKYAQEWERTGVEPPNPPYVSQPNLDAESLRLFNEFRGRVAATVAA